MKGPLPPKEASDAPVQVDIQATLDVRHSHHHHVLQQLHITYFVCSGNTSCKFRSNDEEILPICLLQSYLSIFAVILS